MTPLVLALAAAFGPKIVETIVDAASGDRRSEPAPVRFTPQQAARFSHVVGGARHVDEDIARQLHGMLASRSLVAEPASKRFPGARIWRVVPLQGGKPNAAALVRAGRQRDRVVLVSLSIVLLPTGRAVRPLLVLAPAELAHRLASPAGQLAILDAPLRPVVTTSVAPPVAPPVAAPVAPAVASPATLDTPKANGAAPRAPSADPPAAPTDPAPTTELLS